MASQEIEGLTQALARLPGLGPRSARRAVLHLMKKREAALEPLVDREVRDAFISAIEARRTAGHVLDNRLIGIENAIIERATLTGRNAVVGVRFDAVIAAITRDADDRVVAGTLSDAVQTHEVWTFGRNLDAVDPNWLLIETDDVA